MRRRQDPVLGEGRADELEADRQPLARATCGIEIPGRPARFTGTVRTSDAYIAQGSSTRSPIRNATVGEVGDTTRSTSANAASKSPRMRVRTFWAMP